MRALYWGFCKPEERMSGGCRRCAFCGPESLPVGAARRELGECEGGGLRGIDETDFRSYVKCTNCSKLFGISCMNSIHEAIRDVYDNVVAPDEVDDELGVWAQLASSATLHGKHRLPSRSARARSCRRP